MKSEETSTSVSWVATIGEIDVVFAFVFSARTLSISQTHVLRIEEVMHSVEVSADDVDLLHSAISHAGDIEAVGAFELIQSIPWVNDWRSLITAATSFPQNLYRDSTSR